MKIVTQTGQEISVGYPVAGAATPRRLLIVVAEPKHEKTAAALLTRAEWAAFKAAGDEILDV